MHIPKLAPVMFLLLPLTAAVAGENALWRVEQSCIKYATPESRAECERDQKATMAAFDKEKKSKEKKAKETGEPGKKKNDLCFTRKATGEVVCPN
jgi:hypothetical protein